MINFTSNSDRFMSCEDIREINAACRRVYRTIDNNVGYNVNLLFLDVPSERATKVREEILKITKKYKETERPDGVLPSTHHREILSSFSPFRTYLHGLYNAGWAYNLIIDNILCTDYTASHIDRIYIDCLDLMPIEYFIELQKHNPKLLITELGDDVYCIRYTREDGVTNPIIKCPNITKAYKVLSALMAEAYSIPDKEFIFKLLTEPLDKPIDLDKLKNSIQGLQETIVKDRTDTIAKELIRHNELENGLLEAYRKSLKIKEQLTKKIEELKKSSNTLGDEIIKIVPSMIEKKLIETIDIEGSRLKVKLSTPLFNYNEIAVKKVVDSDYHNAKITTLLKRALIDNDYEIMFTSLVQIDLLNYQIESIWRFSTDNIDTIKKKTRKEHMYCPNPHLTNFNCFGQNGPALVQLLKKGAYSEFFMALIATVGNLNFNDGAVTGRFYSFLEQTNDELPFIRDVKTNDILTMKQFMEKENESSKA